MITVDALRSFGANVDEGLSRCMNNEGFYVRMVRLVLADPNFEKLRRAAYDNDLDAAFEAAHALKGVLANLSLTPVLTPVAELTELFRSRTPGDYRAAADEIAALRDKLAALDA